MVYFADVKSLALPFQIKSISEASSSASSTGIKLRFVTEIIEANISQCKVVVTTGEVRHLEGVKGNVVVSNTEYIAISYARHYCFQYRLLPTVLNRNQQLR